MANSTGLLIRIMNKLLRMGRNTNRITIHIKHFSNLLAEKLGLAQAA